eukprot:116487-Rhodomonas_salina.4
MGGLSDERWNMLCSVPLQDTDPALPDEATSRCQAGGARAGTHCTEAVDAGTNSPSSNLNSKKVGFLRTIDVFGQDLWPTANAIRNDEAKFGVCENDSANSKEAISSFGHKFNSFLETMRQKVEDAFSEANENPTERLVQELHSVASDVQVRDQPKRLLDNACCSQRAR